MSRLRLGKEGSQSGSLADSASGSLDSEAAHLVHPPEDSGQKAENLFVRNPTPASGPIVLFSQRPRKAVLQSSETHHPGTYCPSVSEFDWWPMYSASSTIRSSPLYAANDDDFRLRSIFDISFEESRTNIVNHPGVMELFGELIYPRNTYEDEMVYREKAHHHLVLVTEAHIGSADTHLPNLYQNYLMPWDVLLHCNRIIAEDSIDIPWCVSEILRTMVWELRHTSVSEIFIQLLACLNDFVSGSQKQKIADAFTILISIKVFNSYNPHLLQSSDNHGILPLRIRRKVIRMGLALVRYFDPLRARANVARSDSIIVRSAIVRLKSASLPRTAFRLITALRCAQSDSSWKHIYKFKDGVDPVWDVINELNQPSLMDRELDWMALWTVLSLKTDSDFSNITNLPEICLWLWAGFERFLMKFEQSEELIDFLYGRTEQEPTTSSTHTTDHGLRSSVDGESEAAADGEAWPPAYKAFEAWVDQTLGNSDDQFWIGWKFEDLPDQAFGNQAHKGCDGLVFWDWLT